MKYLFLLCFSMCISISAIGQVTSVSSINVGVTSSFGLSFVTYENNYGNSLMSYDLTPSYGGGIVGNINWYASLGLQVELLYNVQGQYYSSTSGNDYLEKDLRLSYVLIPVLMRYTFNDYSNSLATPIFYGTMGLQLGLLQNAELLYYRNGTQETFEKAHASNPLLEFLPDYTTDEDLFHSFDIQFVLGAGVEFPLTSYMHLAVEARGNYGLKDINDRNWRFPDRRNNYTSSRNFVLGLRVGLMATIW